jgi:hypothetical protein
MITVIHVMTELLERLIAQLDLVDSASLLSFFKETGRTKNQRFTSQTFVETPATISSILSPEFCTSLIKWRTLERFQTLLYGVLRDLDFRLL